MTRKKSDNNRKKHNKITVYLPDDLLAYLNSEAKQKGSNKSIVVQQGLTARKATTNKEG